MKRKAWRAAREAKTGKESGAWLRYWFGASGPFAWPARKTEAWVEAGFSNLFGDAKKA
jgi:hypothetical protein